MKTHEYTVRIESAPEGGYWSHVPALPGCFSQGETIEETILHTKEAIELYLEDVIESGEPLPEDSNISVNVRIPISV